MKKSYVCLTAWGTVVDLGLFEDETEAKASAIKGGLDGLIMDENSLESLFDDVALCLAKAHVRKIERVIKP